MKFCSVRENVKKMKKIKKNKLGKNVGKPHIQERACIYLYK